MRARVAAIPVVLSLFAAVSCGSAGPAPGRSFNLTLAAMPGAFLPMATHGSAQGTIRVLTSKLEVCWSFRRLTGVSDPTRAEIRTGLTGQYGSVEVPLGPRFSASGCTGSVGLSELEAITTDPSARYVVIDSRGYPTTGAIRAQL